MKLFFLIVLTGFAFAQDLPCAKLLDNLPSSSLEGISSIEATMTTRYLEYGDDEVQSYFAKDFTNNRSYHSFSEKIGGDFVVAAVYRYENGVGTLTRGDTTEEAPPEDSIETIEELLEMLEFNPRDIFASGGVESCDGQTTYGSFSGEQVTVSADGEETFLLFDDAGEFIAIASYYSGGELVLQTLEEFVFEGNLLKSGISRAYKLQGETLMPLEERRLEVQSYNQPLDESLFELGE